MSGYRVEELIGAGSSAEVWRGRVVSTAVPVALKRVWLTDRAATETALAEAALLSALDHPHLVKLHEVRRVGDDVVLVLDLAAAGSLSTLLDRRGRLTVGEVVTALAPIGAALAYAHAAAIVHGDVSSANILFTDVGLPLLADLGVSRLLGDATPVRTTPAYADPMVAAGAVPGPSSDVFMLGGVALHALTGAPPWPGSDPSAVLEQAAAGVEPDFDTRLRLAGAPTEVCDVVLRALSLEPTQRGTAADFALDLRHAATPVAVELTAGRPRSTGALTSTGGRGARHPFGTAEDDPETTNPSRLPLTYGVRAPAPFAGARGRHVAAHRRLRVGRGLLATVAAGAVLEGAALWHVWPSPEPRHGSATRPTGASTASAGAGSPAVAASPAAGPRSIGSTPAPNTRAPSVRAVLVALDSVRSHAFAIRRPGALRDVYASTGMLAEDRALLTTIVPPGCGLFGMHTRFADVVVVARSTGDIRLRVRTQVGASRLVCSGTLTGRSAAGPVSVARIYLVRRGGHYLIARWHVVGSA
jgi:hypothetical protein